jgi:hypothetical protein
VTFARTPSLGAKGVITLMSVTDKAMDRRRLMVAVHEMGHAIAWDHGGLTIEAIRVTGRGHGTEGYVELEQRPLDLPTRLQNYLIGLLAGREADHKWCDITGETPDNYGSSTDMEVFRKFRKYDATETRWVTHLSDKELQAEARKIVTARWSQIVRLAETLAERGAIKL